MACKIAKSVVLQMGCITHTAGTHLKRGRKIGSNFAIKHIHLA